MSLLRRPVMAWLRHVERRGLARARSPVSLRSRLERSARIFLRPPRGQREAWDDLGGIAALHVTPRDARPGPAILYLHGGGFIFGSPMTHRALAGTILRRTGGEAWLPRYRLAPEHPLPAALDDALAAYAALRKRHGDVVLGGDSAGGGLVLFLLAELVRTGAPLPRAAFVFSPLADLSYSAPSIAANDATEVVLPTERFGEWQDMVLGGLSPDAPRIAPLTADFRGAPPVWLCASDTEILLDDARAAAARLKSCGVQATLRIESGLPHVWPLFHTLLPESHVTLDALTTWLRDVLAHGETVP